MHEILATARGFHMCIEKNVLCVLLLCVTLGEELKSYNAIGDLCMITWEFFLVQRTRNVGCFWQFWVTGVIPRR